MKINKAIRELACLSFACHLFSSPALAASNTFPDDGNVGIGTTSPGYKLVVSGGPTGIQDVYVGSDGVQRSIWLDGGFGTRITAGINRKPIQFFVNDEERVRFDTNGNVGIGTINPNHKLVVSGGPTSIQDLYIGTDGEQKSIWLDGGFGTRITAGINRKPIQFFVNDEERVRFDTTGNVGIGTTNPKEKLSVDGTIMAKEVKVSISPSDWSDYVFEDTYKLPPLDSVESYIKENKHLPDLPSAADIEQQGLAVSEMLAIQMKKIEELTLYMINLEKENGKLQQRLAALEKN